MCGWHGPAGTLTGVSRYLKQHHNRARVLGVEPPMGHGIQGLKNTRAATCPKIYEPALRDEETVVRDAEAIHITRLLAQREGLFVGMSRGAAADFRCPVRKSHRNGLC